VVLLIAFSGDAHGQVGPATPGPLIQSGGATFEIPAPDFETPLDFEYRVLFDAAAAPEQPGEINAGINSVARFLNMQARAGVPAERMHAALVVHGGASRALLDDAAYRKRYQQANPHAALLREMMAGVRVILCGQSAAGRGIARDELMEGVEMALSAMTARAVLMSEGYQFIAF
jgi:intracellular sulfur oxidation DsrE/DsrF family protein